jgi:hypothetical protein
MANKHRKVWKVNSRNMTLVFIYYLFVPLRKIEKKNKKYATATDHR